MRTAVCVDCNNLFGISVYTVISKEGYRCPICAWERKKALRRASKKSQSNYNTQKDLCLARR